MGGSLLRKIFIATSLGLSSLRPQAIAGKWLRAEVAVPEVTDARHDVEALVDALYDARKRSNCLQKSYLKPRSHFNCQLQLKTNQGALTLSYFLSEITSCLVSSSQFYVN